MELHPQGRGQLPAAGTGRQWQRQRQLERTVVFNYTPPATPTIIAPAPGPLYAPQQTFSWSRVEEATAYSLWLQNDDTNVTMHYKDWPDLSELTIQGETVSWSYTLKAGANYRLRVRAVNGSANGNWSEPVVFTYAPLGAPMVVSPVAGPVLTISPAYKWSNVSNVLAYSVRLQNQDSGVMLIERTLDASEYSAEGGDVLRWGEASPIQPGVNYVFSVGAHHVDGEVLWSPGVAFYFAVTGKTRTTTIYSYDKSGNMTGMTSTTENVE